MPPNGTREPILEVRAEGSDAGVCGGGAVSTKSFDGLLMKGVVVVALACAAGCATDWHGQTAVALTVSGEAPEYYVSPWLRCAFTEDPRTCYLAAMPRLKAQRMSRTPILAPFLLISLPIDSIAPLIFFASVDDDYFQCTASLRPPVDAETAVAQVVAELDVSRRFGTSLAVVAHEGRYQRLQVLTAAGAGAETQGATSTVAPYSVPVQLREFVLEVAGEGCDAKLSATATVGRTQIHDPDLYDQHDKGRAVPVTIPSEQLSACMHGDAQACAPYFDDLLKRLAKAVLVYVDRGL